MNEFGTTIKFGDEDAPAISEIVSDKHLVTALPNLTKEQALVKRGNELIELVTKLEVKDQASLEVATDTVKLIQGVLKGLEAERDAQVRPLNTQVDGINARFKPHTTKLKDAKVLLDGPQGKMTKYMIEEREKQRKAIEEENRKKAEAEAAEAARLAAVAKPAELVTFDDVGPVAVAEVKAVDLPKQQARGMLGSVSGLKKVWKWRVKDRAKVDPNYLMLDEIKLNQAVRQGIREIDGIEIYEEESSGVR